MRNEITSIHLDKLEDRADDYRLWIFRNKGVTFHTISSNAAFILSLRLIHQLGFSEHCYITSKGITAAYHKEK